MAALTPLCAAAACTPTRVPATLRRSLAVAPQRRLQAPPVRHSRDRSSSTASKRGCAVAPTAAAATQSGPSSTKAELDMTRILGLMAHSALKHEQERDALVEKLSVTVATLEGRVAVLEQKLQQEQQRQQRQAEEAEKQRLAAERNRAEQLNPACAAFWTSRGYDHAPWKWDVFKETKLVNANIWPGVIKQMKTAESFNYVDRNKWSVNHWSGFGYDADDAEQMLRQIYDDDDVMG
jgi:hypothetical protein